MAAQPFLLIGPNDRGHDRRHIPDYFFVLRDGTAQIVNVKTAEQLAIPKVAATLEWAHATFAMKGWRTEIWTGANPILLSNIRFLAAYRRHWLFNDRALGMASGATADGATINDVEVHLRSVGISKPRPLILHLLWNGSLRADLMQPLELTTRLECVS